jgi:hypothetical protein
MSGGIGFDLDEFPFWIDAICINQTNIDEKSLQIPMMGDIFSTAMQVIAWLGENTPDEDKIVRFIFEAPNSFLDALILNEAIDEEAFRSALQCYPTNDTLRPLNYEITDYFALKNSWLTLLRKPWFTRKWVVQEICLSTR